MIARLLSAGFVLAVANLLPPTMTDAMAAHAAWTGGAVAGKRVQFRPVTRPTRQVRYTVPRWRPSAQPFSRSLDRLGSPLINAAKSRDPVVRSYARGLRSTAGVRPVPRYANFRPRPGAVSARGNTAAAASTLHTQFRPTTKRRKQTYEQMLAVEGRRYPAYPYQAARYPRTLVPGYATHWPVR